MSRVRRVGIDPSRPESVVDQVNEIIFEMDGKLSFGEPLDPNDETSVILAGGVGGTAHNGTRSNIWGSWVEVEFETLDTEVVCNHNLYLDQPGGYTTEPVAGSPNCRWFVVGWQHDGESQTYWEDLRVPVSSTKKGGIVDPDFELFLNDVKPVPVTTGVFLYWFDPDVEEELFFTTQMPHNWHEGTSIYPHVHWVPDINAAGADQCVKWGLEYTWADIGDVFAVPTIIYTDATNDTTQTDQGVQLVANTHYTSHFYEPANGLPAIDGSGHTISSMLCCRIFRDATDGTDDYLGEAGLLEVDFHYQVDGLGSDAATPITLGGIASKTAGVELEWNPQNIRYQAGDTLTANSIGLRAYTGPGLLVDSSHKLKVTLFFIKASR